MQSYLDEPSDADVEPMVAKVSRPDATIVTVTDSGMVTAMRRQRAKQRFLRRFYNLFLTYIAIWYFVVWSRYEAEIIFSIGFVVRLLTGDQVAKYEFCNTVLRVVHAQEFMLTAPLHDVLSFIVEWSCLGMFLVAEILCIPFRPDGLFTPVFNPTPVALALGMVWILR